MPLLIIVGLMVSQSVSAQSNTFFNQTFTLPANGRSCYYDAPEYVYDAAGSTVIGTITVSSGYVDFFILNGAPPSAKGPLENGCQSLEPNYWELHAANLSPINGYSFTYNVPDNGEYYFVFYNTQAMAATVTIVLSWANSPTTTTSEQVNYPSYTPYTYETQPTQVFSQTTAQTIATPFPYLEAVVVVVILALALVAVALYYGGVIGERQARGQSAPQPLKQESVTKPKAEKSSLTGKQFCIECGSELPSGSKFCNKCGSKQA